MIAVLKIPYRQPPNSLFNSLFQVKMEEIVSEEGIETSASNLTGAENCSFPADFDSQQIIYGHVSFWLECVAEIAIGILGFLGNAVAIPLLMSERLASTFNRLLICLSIFDNLFIFSCLLEAIRRFIGTSNIHQLAFIYFFYQLQSIALLCSINTTVVLAIER